MNRPSIARDMRRQAAKDDVKIVTRTMGPIACVMAKRAADAAAGSRTHFIRLLLEALPQTHRGIVQGEIDKLG